MHLSIKQWKEDDRPREKLMLKGKSSLSDVELLALLIGSGTKANSAIDIARHIMESNENQLDKLAGRTVNDLCRFRGIGRAKAVLIVSALELGRRRGTNKLPRQVIIRSSSDVHQLMKVEMMDLKSEEFWVILLNRRNGVIRKVKISSGGLTGTVVDPRIIFKQAIEEYATSIILVHNHPSGNIKPSNEDIRLTRSMKEAGEFLEIQVLDHVIFSNASYFSFADEGMMV